MMEKQEQLNLKERAKQKIDHYVNDFGEYPDVWLRNEEKVDKDGRRYSDQDFAKKYWRWQHNKYSITWWFTPIIPEMDLIIMQILPEDKKAYFFAKLEELMEIVREEGKSNVTKDTVDRAEALLKEIKEAI